MCVCACVCVWDFQQCDVWERAALVSKHAFILYPRLTKLLSETPLRSEMCEEGNIVRCSGNGRPSVAFRGTRIAAAGGSTLPVRAATFQFVPL